MKPFLKCIFPVITVLLTTCFMFAQTAEADLRQEVDEIRQNQETIQNDLSEIKALLLKLVTAQHAAPRTPQQPPQVNIKGTTFDIGDNRVLGSESARVIIVEFTDYQCSFCGRYSRETFPHLREQYIEKGAIRYVVIDQPLPIHQEAAKAAEAAHCAGDQGKFWEMHEEMMAKQDALKDLFSYAKTLNLNVGEFEDCLNTGTYRSTVIKNMELAKELGISGVPCFIIGTVDESDSRRVTGISLIRGAVPLVNFQQEIDAALQHQ